jgi:hypothetical protein
MSETALLSQVQKLSEKVSEKLNECLGVFGSVKELIVEHFGQNGLIAAYIVVAVLILVIVSRLVKITFATIKYLIIPAVALAALGTFVLPYSFFMLLPVTVTACSLLLLFKG